MIHVLLAAYNEQEAIGHVLDGMARCLAGGDYKVWVVDDGSTDGTVDEVSRWKQTLPIQLIRHDRNRGLGAALQSGFSALASVVSDDDVVVTLDADNTHPPSLIGGLVFPIQSGSADVVVASRFVPGARVVGVPLHRRLFSRVASWLFRWGIPMFPLKDYTCGYRAYRGSLVKTAVMRAPPFISEKGFAATAEIIVKIGALRPRIREIPLTLRYDRKPGESKMRIGRTVFRNLSVLIRLRRFR